MKLHRSPECSGTPSILAPRRISCARFCTGLIRSEQRESGISDKNGNHRDDEPHDADYGEDGAECEEKAAQHRWMQPGIAWITGADKTVMPTIGDLLTRRQRTFVEVASGEPSGNCGAVTLEHCHFGALPTAL